MELKARKESHSLSFRCHIHHTAALVRSKLQLSRFRKGMEPNAHPKASEWLKTKFPEGQGLDTASKICFCSLRDKGVDCGPGSNRLIMWGRGYQVRPVFAFFNEKCVWNIIKRDGAVQVRFLLNNSPPLLRLFADSHRSGAFSPCSMECSALSTSSDPRRWSISPPPLRARISTRLDPVSALWTRRAPTGRSR